MSEPIRPLVPQPCTLVIFGGSGDLARRKLIPAVYNLVLDGVLPPNYAILGNARKPLSDADFRQMPREGVVKYPRQKINEKVWPEFEGGCSTSPVRSRIPRPTRISKRGSSRSRAT